MPFLLVYILKNFNTKLRSLSVKHYEVKNNKLIILYPIMDRKKYSNSFVENHVLYVPVLMRFLR